MKDKHDQFFKHVFKDPENTRSFIKDYLPARVSKELDLSSVQVHDPGSNSEEETEYISDIVVSCKTRNGKPADLYFLFEHKSYKDKHIYLQLLRYLYEAWSTDYRRKREYRVIIPVVFYHGKSEWNLSVHFIDNFEVSEDLKAFMLDFSYLLFDTNKWHPDLKKPETDNIYLLCSMMLMKMAYHNDWEGVKSILQLMDEKGLLSDRQRVIFIFKYIVYTQEVDKESFIDLLKGYDEGGDIMPVADLIREEGRKEGIQIGEQRGEQRGKLKGEIKRLQETLIKLIGKKYGITESEKDFIKSVTDLDKLDKATEAILSEDNKEKLLSLLK